MAFASHSATLAVVPVAEKYATNVLLKLSNLMAALNQPNMKKPQQRNIGMITRNEYKLQTSMTDEQKGLYTRYSCSGRKLQIMSAYKPRRIIYLSGRGGRRIPL